MCSSCIYFFVKFFCVRSQYKTKGNNFQETLLGEGGTQKMGSYRVLFSVRIDTHTYIQTNTYTQSTLNEKKSGPFDQ